MEAQAGDKPETKESPTDSGRSRLFLKEATPRVLLKALLIGICVSVAVGALVGLVSGSLGIISGIGAIAVGISGGLAIRGTLKDFYVRSVPVFAGICVLVGAVAYATMYYFTLTVELVNLVLKSYGAPAQPSILKYAVYVILIALKPSFQVDSYFSTFSGYEVLFLVLTLYGVYKVAYPGQWFVKSRRQPASAPPNQAPGDAGGSNN